MTTFASDGTTITTPAVSPAPTEPEPEVLAATGAESAPAPEPEVGDPAAGQTLPAVRTSTDIAAVDQWEHDWLEFKGDKLGIRAPAPQAMSALSIGLGKFVPPRTQNDVAGLFIARHLSPDSYEHVYSRLMDPDDTEYDSNTIGELIGAILNTGVDAFERASKSAQIAADAAEK